MDKTEKICKTCLFWQPNGGILGVGYCLANKWTYRKPTQHCDKWTDGTVAEGYDAKIKYWQNGMNQ